MPHLNLYVPEVDGHHTHKGGRTPHEIIRWVLNMAELSNQELATFAQVKHFMNNEDDVFPSRYLLLEEGSPSEGFVQIAADDGDTAFYASFDVNGFESQLEVRTRSRALLFTRRRFTENLHTLLFFPVTWWVFQLQP